MRLLFYGIIMNICWLVESIHDKFSKDDSLFYPSIRWEILYDEELKKIGR